ncbi:MAG: tRNA dihydrouridine(20/20a) synthase DusA, partial [Thiogranum sp.]
MCVNPCPVSVAPMMDWTDRHCRYFLRLISRHVRLYTEMITSAALLHGDRDHLLAFDVSEHPLAIQLGGSEPEDLARCAAWAEQSGFDEINLNVGCPSDRVQSGQFGACLMLEPERVAAGVAAMRQAVAVPVTVKTRLGVDEQDSYDELTRFVSLLQDAGLERLIVHARKAWLQGLSPKQNREVPPLRYDWVYQIKKDFPSLHIHINGGVKTMSE